MFLCALATVLQSFSAVVGGKVNFCVTHRFFGNTAGKSVARGNKVSNFMQPAKIFVKRRIVSVRQRRGAWGVGRRHVIKLAFCKKQKGLCKLDKRCGAVYNTSTNLSRVTERRTQ